MTAAAISPDGLQLAYADITGSLFVAPIDNKRTRLLRHPEGVVMEKLTWLPDLSALLAFGRRLQDGSASAWIVQLNGAEPRLAQNDIESGALSPDGYRMLFISQDSREIWITRLNSNVPARKLVTAGEDETFQVAFWSADGSHVLCQRRKQLQRVQTEARAGDFESRFLRTYESMRADTGSVVYKQENVSMRSAAVQPNGRVLFLWPNINGYSTNMWQMKTDPVTGKIQEQPRTLTQYREMALAGTSTSMDGKRMVAVHYQAQPDVYVADFDPRAKRILSARRVTMDRGHDYPHTFSPDGETVFFESNRNGSFDVFRQSLNQRYAELLVGRPDRDEFNPIVTPDGKWILFASASTDQKKKDRHLERIPIGGGEPSIVPTGGTLDYFDCALPGGKRCVVRTTENQEYVFYELDPMAGKSGELARVPWSPGLMGDWCISADGSEVAIPNHDLNDRFIRVVPLGAPGKLGIVVHLKGAKGMISGAHSSADSNGWFVVLRHDDELFRATPLRRVDLAYVDRHGVVTPLREISISSWGVPAAGGKRIAFPDGSMTGNAVLFER